MFAALAGRRAIRKAYVVSACERTRVEGDGNRQRGNWKVDADGQRAVGMWENALAV